MTVKIDVPQAAFTTVTLILFLGTVYSVKNSTYLDTSDPSLTHLPHHLHKTDYFASKSNILNVWFIKRSWGWTSLAFLFLWLTSPPKKRTLRRVLKWSVEMLVWLVFTSWFFGPALLERLIAVSGGECTVALPSGVAFSVPNEFCFTKSTVSPLTHPSLFAMPFVLPEEQWTVIPRLRKGHDVSGHVFLLTMSVLFLADQIEPSLRAAAWSRWHRWAVGFTASVLGLGLLSLITTSVYFHTPLEKFTGYLLGVAGYSLTRMF
ncbi:inositol phospholipid synthesis and fat-storage-inducing TM-domain-containing protein [Phlebopus sp. FC_14]|nr:inositol phospholipid synthesis and fat-storage-inducing TM-domain-containing protein [Phlebopus sp. FC_14]